MADQDSDGPQLLRAAVSLTRPMRWAALVLGLAGLVAGGTAVFSTRLEAGPVALLAVGLILALMGLAGVMPTRLKVGDNEAEFYQEQQRQVARVLQEEVESAAAQSLQIIVEGRSEAELLDQLAKKLEPGSAERTDELARIVDRVAAVAPEVAAPAQSSYKYEFTVRQMLQDVMDGLPGPRVMDVAADFDATLEIQEPAEDEPGRQILVQIKGGRSVGREALFLIMKQAREYAVQCRDEIGVRLLLVTRYPVLDLALPADGVNTFEVSRGTYLVAIAGREDYERLEMAVYLAMDGPPIL
jgi:hypothetical protein